MEQSSFVEHEPSVYPPSEVIQGHDVERELQEEYEAEQKDIEEGVSSLDIFVSPGKFIKWQKN